MDQAYHYWRFNLSPFIFEVKNLSFMWVTTWWGISLICASLIGVFGLIRSRFVPQKYKEIIKNIFFYVALVFAALFLMNKMNIDWGLRWYSLMYIIGFLAVYFSLDYWSKKRLVMLTESGVVTLITFAIVGMLVGARFFYVFIYNWSQYKDNWLDIFATWQGGLSFHGGIVGCCIAFMLYCKLHKVPFFHITDKLVRLVPVGIGFGRVGNFLNGELWGREISGHLPWAIIFPSGGDVPRHPSQLYQSFFEGWLLLLTLYLLSRKPRHEGQISSFFLIFYCLYRFIMEYFRAADEQLSYFFINHFDWAPLNTYSDAAWWQVFTMGQILCIVFFIFGLVLWSATRNNILELSPKWKSRNEAFFKKHSADK